VTCLALAFARQETQDDRRLSACKSAEWAAVPVEALLYRIEIIDSLDF
jgi:hypothetical protein